MFKFGQYGYAYGHYVHEAHRDEGIGTALPEAAERWFTEKDLLFWRIDVLHDESAAEVYKEHGMRPMETVHEKEL